jgi:uncharacterized protein YjhX (UPF0386 family)
MKSIFKIIAILSVGIISAQTNNDKGGSGFVNNIEKAANGNNAFGASTIFVNPGKKAEGSVHLFKKWDNRGVIHSSNGQKFSIKNINLNIERNAFESKIGEDSLFTFNFNNIKLFVINDKKFKNYYHKGESKVFQSLYVQPNYEILRGFNIQLVKGSVNPMLNRSTDKYVQKSTYYIRENDLIRPLRLKKKSILRLVDNDSKKAKELIEYLKKQ